MMEGWKIYDQRYYKTYSNCKTDCASLMRCDVLGKLRPKNRDL